MKQHSAKFSTLIVLINPLDSGVVALPFARVGVINFKT